VSNPEQLTPVASLDEPRTRPIRQIIAEGTVFIRIIGELTPNNPFKSISVPIKAFRKIYGEDGLIRDITSGVLSGSYDDVNRVLEVKSCEPSSDHNSLTASVGRWTCSPEDTIHEVQGCGSGNEKLFLRLPRRLSLLSSQTSKSGFYVLSSTGCTGPLGFYLYSRHDFDILVNPLELAANPPQHEHIQQDEITHITLSSLRRQDYDRLGSNKEEKENILHEQHRLVGNKIRQMAILAYQANSRLPCLSITARLSGLKKKKASRSESRRDRKIHVDKKACTKTKIIKIQGKEVAAHSASCYVKTRIGQPLPQDKSIPQIITAPEAMFKKLVETLHDNQNKIERPIVKISLYNVDRNIVSMEKPEKILSLKADLSRCMSNSTSSSPLCWVLYLSHDHVCGEATLKKQAEKAVNCVDARILQIGTIIRETRPSDGIGKPVKWDSIEVASLIFFPAGPRNLKPSIYFYGPDQFFLF